MTKLKCSNDECNLEVKVRFVSHRMLAFTANAKICKVVIAIMERYEA